MLWIYRQTGLHVSVSLSQGGHRRPVWYRQRGRVWLRGGHVGGRRNRRDSFRLHPQVCVVQTHPEQPGCLHQEGERHQNSEIDILEHHGDKNLLTLSGLLKHPRSFLTLVNSNQVQSTAVLPHSKYDCLLSVQNVQ